MSIYHGPGLGSGCGGYELSAKLTQHNKSCETGKIKEFSMGDHLKWNTHNNNMGDCSSTEFDLDEPFLNFRLISSNDNYCPGTLLVNFEHSIYYDFYINGYYDAANNNKVHSAERTGNYLDSILLTINSKYSHKQTFLY